MNRAVFLDRDGVINALVYRPQEGLYDSPYCPEEFCLLPMVAKAVAHIHQMGMLAIVISNQPGVAKGKCDVATVDMLTQHMCNELEGQAAFLDGIYYCLHHPEGVVAELRVCDCRKPKPGLLLRAAREHSIDLAHSYMIGDSQKDVEAGLAAGCITILVGQEVHADARESLPFRPHLLANNLLEAVLKIQRKGI